MPIDFRCQGCGKHYRVRDEFAGRVAECKNCGTKMTVPRSGDQEQPRSSSSPSIGFADEESAPRQPARPAAQRPAPNEYETAPEPEGEPEQDYSDDESGYDDSESESGEVGIGAEPDDQPLRNFDVKDDEPEQTRARRVRQTPLLPDIVGETVVPLAAIAIGLGGGAFVAGKAALNSSSPLIGFVLLAVAIGLFFVVMLPLAIKALEAAANKLGFELANALKLQTMGLLAIPTGAATFGYFENGISGGINWGIFGLIVMAILIVLIYRTDLINSAMSAIWMALCYALTAGLGIGIAAGLAFGLSKAHVRMPWEPKAVVAKVDPEAEKKQAERKQQEEFALAEANKPKVEEAPKPVVIEPEKPAVSWSPIVDAPATPVRWPSDLKNQLIDVKPPVTMARSSPGSPFVAFVDGVALNVYDVRSGKRTGFIKDKPPVNGALLSPDGTILIINRRAQGNSNAGSGAAEFEIWSMPEGRQTRKLTFDSSRPLPMMLGYDNGNRLITAGESNGKGIVQAWDLRAASPTQTIEGPRQLADPKSVALSAGGRFVACVADGHLNIFDLNTGSLVCDKQMPRKDAQVRAMSFARDGSQLAIVTNEANTNKLIIFDNKTGEIALDAELGGGSRPDLTSEQITWVPRGGALLIENDWVDAATGRIVAIIPPQTAGPSTGKPKAMMSDSLALIEFQPAGNAQRVIYKGVSLNKKDIDAALASRRSKSSPGDASPTEAAEAPIVIPPTADAKELTRQAIDHLANNRNREALAFAQAAVDKLPKTPKVESDDQAIALHALAAAYMRAGDASKARDPIDRAFAYSKTSRSLVLNHAKLDIAGQNFVLRAVRDLDKQLATNVDEETLNLFGLGIGKLAPPQVAAAQIKAFVDKLDAYNKKLESAKPGMKRWGNTWVSETEYATAAAPPDLLAEKAKGEERVKLAAADLERTRKAFADAKKQALYDERKKDIPRDSARKNQPVYLSKAEDAYAAAQKEVEASKLDLDAINSRFPKPPYEENFEPVVPETELVAKS